MEQDIFIKLLNMSYQGGIVICVIVLARFILHLIKVPKRYAYYLWLIAFIRLICPFSLESVLSILPQETEPIKTTIIYDQIPEIHTESATINQAVNNVVPKANQVASINPMQVIMNIIQMIWLVGIAVFLFYSVISFIRLKKRLVGSMNLRENIYIADHIETPFVMGVLKPHIYLPSTIEEKEISYILMHEQAHVKRKDHIIKLIVFGITIIHWFNPFVWVAYVLMNQDMEMSCDEYVIKRYPIKNYNEDIRKAYATSLLNLSVGRRKILGVPLAFGEGNVKGRIKNVTRYKKPLISVGICAVIGIVILGVSLLTSPLSTTTLNKVVNEINTIDENKIESIVITTADGEQTFSSVYGNQIIEFFKSLKVEKKEISTEHNVNQNQDSSVRISYSSEQNTSYVFYISDDIIWFDSGVNPSYSYRIVNPDEVNDFITRLFGSITESTEVPITDENMKEIKISTPTIDLEANLGADGVLLDYADDNIVIFHGYFGLFVYDLHNQKLVRAVDLSPIGCNYTQGDNYCEVVVSDDGAFVYLHPLSESEMYVFHVSRGKLYKTTYNLDGIVLFDKLDDNYDLVSSGEGFYSMERVVFETKEGTYYGYLSAHGERTIGELNYVVDDMVYSIFDSLDKESASLEALGIMIPIP
jgi:bla regulator protein blaR1